jgi:hypothetical protein
MAVRNENVIGHDPFHVDLLREWGGCDEGIEEERFAASFDGKAGMAIVDEFHGMNFELRIANAEVKS